MGALADGVYPALTTPFSGGEVDREGLARNVARFEATGMAGYLLLGSTGEAVMLDAAERRVVLDAARRAIPPGRGMIAGVTAESTRAAGEQAEAAADAGADQPMDTAPSGDEELAKQLQAEEQVEADHAMALPPAAEVTDQELAAELRVKNAVTPLSRKAVITIG